MQKLQDVKSVTGALGWPAWFSRGSEERALIRILRQIGLVESSIPDLPVANVDLVGGCSCSDMNILQIERTELDTDRPTQSKGQREPHPAGGQLP